ncbi:MAG: 1,4-dihydroxy-2-naphthoate octaprenyltransferase, partial [Burkholderiales bacterium]|nr:1,4-dihydroxy-2-naphthoate octaprenyltransferase [Burkholderiales bacterium]
TLLVLPQATRLVQQIKTTTPETATKLMLGTIRMEFVFGLLLTLGALAAFDLLWPMDMLYPAKIFSLPF